MRPARFDCRQGSRAGLTNCLSAEVPRLRDEGGSYAPLKCRGEDLCPGQRRMLRQLAFVDALLSPASRDLLASALQVFGFNLPELTNNHSPG